MVKIRIKSPIEGSIKEAIETGKQIIMHEWREGRLAGYHSNTIEKIKDYKIGANKKVDAALYYFHTSIADYSNQIPRRVKIEMGLQNLESILK